MSLTVGSLLVVGYWMYGVIVRFLSLVGIVVVVVVALLVPVVNIPGLGSWCWFLCHCWFSLTFMMFLVCLLSDLSLSWCSGCMWPLVQPVQVHWGGGAVVAIGVAVVAAVVGHAGLS